MKKKYDLIVFGATGFTGYLVCEYLSKHKESNQIKWAIAGRNREKLSRISKEFSVDMILSNSFNLESLKHMTSQTKSK